MLMKTGSASIGVALASALGSFIFGASPSAAQVNCRRVLNERCSQTYRVDAGKATHTSQGRLEAENPVTVPSGYVVVNFREINESSQTGGGTFNVSYAARGTISNLVRQYASESSRISDYKAKVDALYQGSQGSEKAKLDILRNQLNDLRSAASTSSSVNTNTDTFTLRATSQYQCTRMVFGECVDGRGGHGKGSLIVDLVFVGDNPSAMLNSIGQQIAQLRSTTSGKYSLICLVNKTDMTINYRGKWSNETESFNIKLNPRGNWQHWRENSSAQFIVSYDSALSQGQDKWQSYNLSTGFAKDTQCSSGKKYSFDYTDSSRQFLGLYPD